MTTREELREMLTNAPPFGALMTPPADLAGWREPGGSLVVCYRCAARITARGFTGALRDLHAVFGETLPECSLCGRSTDRASEAREGES